MLGYKTIALAGGVSANSGVRQTLQKVCDENGYTLYMPPLNLCGDNGAMISCQGYFEYLSGKRADESLNAVATLSIENLK
jgi:N6-L-threonylcarbamoyladenine synthase